MDSAVKSSLLETVNDCVKELQLKCTSERTNSLNNDEATNSFLWVLEAIFIHGLNNSFLKASFSSPFSSIMSSFSSGRNRSSGSHYDAASPQVPNPSFWEFVLVFLHRDIIEQINSLHLIHTDVGRCRAWLRISLNEGLLLSFVENMTLKTNRRCLKAFYRSSAFLRDTEKCDILKNYLLGIELLDFRLVINNSFLNHWNSGPLSLVGLWVDENSSVQQGVDVAQNLESKDFQAIPKLQKQQKTSPKFQSEVDSLMGKQQPPLLSQDDALRIILSSSSPRSASLHQPQPPKRMSTTPSPSSSKFHQPQSRRPPPSPPKTMTHAQRQNLEAVDLEVEEALTRVVRSTGDPIPERNSSTTNKPTVIISSSPSTSSSLSSGTASVTGTGRAQETLDKPEATEENNRIPQHDHNSDQTGGENKEGSQTIVLSSSPTTNFIDNHHHQHHDPQQELSPIKNVESPTDENQSYADLLLKYQKKNQHQQEEQEKAEHQLDSSCNSYGNSNDNDTAIDLSFQENSTNHSHSHKSSSSVAGSVKTATTSSNKSMQLTRAKSRLAFVDEGVSLIRAPRSIQSLIMELRPRISHYTKTLATEVGLDTQNYACKMCSTSIGMIYGAAHLCHFTGAMYCASCHENHEKAIPSRILLNWDFGLYPVCRQAFDFLEEIKDSVIFDVDEINSMLHKEVDEMAQVQIQRTKLLYIGKYLKTCKNTKPLEEIKEAGARGKEHFLDSIHLYSLTDLMSVPNKSLLTLLLKLVATGSGHILTCKICREKGFICEICKNAEVIFPFQLDRIFKCNDCGAVYHHTCMNYEKKCPRCERWKKNETASSVSLLQDDAIDEKEGKVFIMD